MLSTAKNYGLFWLAIILLCLVGLIFYLGFTESHRKFTFAMLDVGQGDALFIESPTGTQILVDGGPPRRILGRLARVMPLFDRTIDAIIITNPDRDHMGGFLDVLKTYKVKQVIEPGTSNDESAIYQELKEVISKKNIPTTLAKKGMRIDLGGGVFLDILFPDRDVSTWTTNDGSIVARLSYGETSVMLTGDTTAETEKIILSENSKEVLDSDILKVAHHGSKTSSTPLFLQAVGAPVAVIPVGYRSRFGHPKAEVLARYQAMGTAVWRTDLDGAVSVSLSDKGAAISGWRHERRRYWFER